MCELIPRWFAFTALTMLLWGLAGVTQKMSTARLNHDLAFAAFCAAMILISLITWMVSPRVISAAPISVVLAVLAGCLNGLGMYALFAAMSAGGSASVTTAIASLYPLVAVVLGVTILDEHLSMRQLWAVACAGIATILLSMESTNARAGSRR
jgi:uncharacterized membrane protein